MPASKKVFGDYDEPALNAVTKAIKQLENLFKKEFDLDIYLTWGTLLGVVREGDYIPFDNDVDLAYLTKKQTDFEITEEHELIVRVLLQNGFPVQRNSKGQIHVRVVPSGETTSAPIFNLDLWTTWERDENFFHYPDIKGEISAQQVLPLKRINFREQSLWIPEGFPQILTQFYGEDWQSPDPNYAWYPKYNANDEFEFLRSSPQNVSVPDCPSKSELLTIEERDGYYFANGPTLKVEQRLNPTGLLILELCNGRNSCTQIIELVQEAFELTSAPEVVTLEFISNAVEAGLIVGVSKI